MNLEHYPEELEGVFAKISDLLTERGVEAELAAEAAFAITEFMRREWGGVAIYFRKPHRKETAENPTPALFDVPESIAPTEPDARDYHALLAARCTEILTGMNIYPALGQTVADMVRDDWTGQAVYVNKGLKWQLARRDYAIWREWDGSYAVKMALMKQNNISEVRFYQVINAVRKREFRRTQPVLPGVVGE
jgi:Mor family transcriptional regulator